LPQPPAGRIVCLDDNKVLSPELLKLERNSRFLLDRKIEIWLNRGHAFVQLAFGHSRLAAFQELSNGTREDKWSLMSVQTGNFTDEEMAAVARSENSAGKNLTPIPDNLSWNKFRRSEAREGKEFETLEYALKKKYLITNSL